MRSRKTAPHSMSLLALRQCHFWRKESPPSEPGRKAATLDGRIIAADMHEAICCSVILCAQARIVAPDARDPRERISGDLIRNLDLEGGGGFAGSQNRKIQKIESLVG
jgi:hypothetical protein